MENKKSIFDYLTQVFCLFGISMVIMAVLCLIFGNEEQEYSRMFRLGSEGMPIDIMLEFLIICVLTVLARIVFFTDVIIKKMTLALRTACMFAAVIIVVTIIIIAFNWFPTDMWEPWALFILCFIISAGVSVLVMYLKERTENRQMETALKKAQEELKR